VAKVSEEFRPLVMGAGMISVPCPAMTPFFFCMGARVRRPIVKGPIREKHKGTPPNLEIMICAYATCGMSAHIPRQRLWRTSSLSPGISRRTVVEMEIQTLRNLRRMEARLLLLDEVHNILAGSAKERRSLLNTLRYVSNELKISLVCHGISDTREAIGGDAQLAWRLEELALRHWKGDEEDFQELVVCILRHIAPRAPNCRGS
jgi:hypothetical protein